MGKLKDALIRKQESSGKMIENETILWGIRTALIDAIENPEPDEGLASAEHALALLNQILIK